MLSAVRQSLDGEWEFRQASSEEWLPGTVPGGVHTDLLRLGRIADPFVGDEEARAQWVAKEDWEYRRAFTPDRDLLAMPLVFLVCDGLDTLAEVLLNGRRLGRAENMFREYRWDIRRALRPGENELRILFRSPTQYAAEHNKVRSMPDVNNPLPGAPYLRKAPSHFGWDWGPQLPAVGLWRTIRLEGYSTARLDDVALHQEHSNGRVTLSTTATAEIAVAKITVGAANECTPLPPLHLSLSLISPDGRAQSTGALLEGDRQRVSLTVDEPQLWWPNDYGAQPLYQVAITLASGETVLDERRFQVGLRTVELRQEPDEWGRSFTFVVNGVPVFAKGSNWIPADTFPTRVTHKQLDHLLASATVAHHNMIRAWGGGYYEDDYFYELCDRYGLLVWQDFIFACAGYPLDDEEFIENVRSEVLYNVRRLRHHASLAIWCGNNEIDTAWADWGWNTPEHADLIKAYRRFFYERLPEWVQTEDPDRPYWPSSPSSGAPLHDPNGVTAGDVHQWAVWHANKAFSNYRETPARFVSEFGFESLPNLSTIGAFAEPPDWNITSYVMEYHQRSPLGNEKIVLYLLNNFRLPKDFPSLIYLSQLLQAEAMRSGVEHWRRHPACSGALYWQLNDCWPAVSWSSIDYYGRWKAMHYSSRRFFSPLLLSIEDNDTAMTLFVTNERLEPWAGEVHWSLETLSGERLDSGQEMVSAGPFSTAHIASLDFRRRVTGENRRGVIVVCELWREGEQIQRTVAAFAPTKHINLGDPHLAVELTQRGEELEIELWAGSFARFVELALDGADVIFSDNYFDLPAGRTAHISCPLPEGWTLTQARGALRLRSVFGSY
ncbi:MAG: glycoside hydrolase family 2 protein [Chloroflexi bacterium]|nr:glycoside hydrolase family 2 protein [Chloroflexota bacterium]